MCVHLHHTSSPRLGDANVSAKVTSCLLILGASMWLVVGLDRRWLTCKGGSNRKAVGRSICVCEGGLPGGVSRACVGVAVTI